MNYKNKKVLVIGLARSGKAAIRLLNKLGADIYLSERKEPSKEDLSFLDEYKVTVYNQDMSVFEKDYDLVIKNPGVPPVSPIVKRLNERNIPIITEIELAYSVSKPQHYIAITGTNGKTTTTTLVYEILKVAYKDKALVGGNIGTPLCELVLNHNLMEEEGYYISLEISNHQLVDIDSFRPEVSTIINLGPDHLETMGSLEAYYKSKTEVYRNQKDNDLFLMNIDDELVKEYTNKYPVKCNVSTFSTSDEADAYLKDNNLYINDSLLISRDKIKIVGIHNIQNILVSALACLKVGVSKDIIASVIENFAGVEHRIEFVREVNGVRYYNDSKGTNVDATITAMKAFVSNVILLVGGYEKGLDVKPMIPYLSSVKQIIGFGASGKRIAFDLVNNPIVVGDLIEAINEANKIATKGDIVLLSPTTSSYDQYSGYEERGRHFKQIVNSL